MDEEVTCNYERGCITAVLYHCIIQHSERSIVLYNTPKVEQRPNAFIVADELGCQIATTRDTKLCKRPQQLCPDIGYEVELE